MDENVANYVSEWTEKKPSIPKRILTRLYGGPSKQRRKRRPNAKRGRTLDITSLMPRPKRFSDKMLASRRRLLKHLNHHGDWPGTPQGNTTIYCPDCDGQRDAEKAGGGWKKCNTCGVKVR